MLTPVWRRENLSFTSICREVLSCGICSERFTSKTNTSGGGSMASGAEQTTTARAQQNENVDEKKNKQRERAGLERRATDLIAAQEEKQRKPEQGRQRSQAKRTLKNGGRRSTGFSTTAGSRLLGTPLRKGCPHLYSDATNKALENHDETANQLLSERLDDVHM